MAQKSSSYVFIYCNGDEKSMKIYDHLYKYDKDRFTFIDISSLSIHELYFLECKHVPTILVTNDENNNIALYDGYEECVKFIKITYRDNEK